MPRTDPATLAVAAVSGGVLGGTFLLVGVIAPILVGLAAWLAGRWFGKAAALAVIIGAVMAVGGIVAYAYLGGWRPGPTVVSG